MCCGSWIQLVYTLCMPDLCFFQTLSCLCGNGEIKTIFWVALLYFGRERHNRSNTRQTLVLGLKTHHINYPTSYTLPLRNSHLCCSIHVSKSFSDWKAETGNIDSCGTAILVCSPCISPTAGLFILAPVYMMEHVKPQHSFSRVRPVLVKGEEVCWALDGTRLVGTPGAERDHTEREKWNKNGVLYCIRCVAGDNFIWGCLSLTHTYTQVLSFICQCIKQLRW